MGGNGQFGALGKINQSLDEFEALVLFIAMCKSFMLLGRHGCGKTRAAKALSKGYEDEITRGKEGSRNETS